MSRTARLFLTTMLAMALVTGCGSSGSPSSSTSAAQPPAAPATPAQTTTSASVVPLSAEVKSAATGDIPDTQVYLTYTNPGVGYSMSYPEGWTRKGSGDNVTISNNNNIIHVVISTGGAATTAGVATELNHLKQSTPTLKFTAPKNIQLKSGPAVKATYSTRSAPNPVTGKSVLLIVDRYELSGHGKRATVDLGTPQGVDNVDAYRMISNSFRWL